VRTRRGSFPRKRHLAVAVALGVAVAITPVVASFATEPTIEAAGNGYGGYSWSPSMAEVAAGGTVAFQNTSAGVPHGVVWTSGPETPSCPGVPINEGKTSWKGTCTFTHAGTYNFHCYVHPTEMTGTITVNANGTTTTTTTTTPPPTTTTPPPTTTPSPPSGPLLAGLVSKALKLAKSQRGGVVKGSLDISKAGAGDRLEVDLLSKSASLAKAKHATSVRVGRFVRASVSAGKLSFVVELNAKARRALKRHGRLALTVKIMLTPTSGEPFSVTRAVVEHA